VTLVMKNMPGVELKVFANSTTFKDGSKTGVVSISQVQLDKVPMPPADGVIPSIAWTVQPAGVVFDPPAQVTLPNSDGLPAGSIVEIYQFDHDLFVFTSVGQATVSDDGLSMVSDPDFGITRSGWGHPRPRPRRPSICAAKCGDKDGCTMNLCVQGRCVFPPITGISCCPVEPVEPFGPDDSQGEYDPSDLTPGTQAAIECLKERLAYTGGTVSVNSGYRSQEYQDHLRDVWDANDELSKLPRPLPQKCVDDQVERKIKEHFKEHNLNPNRGRRPVNGSYHSKKNAFDANIKLGGLFESIGDQIQACGICRPSPWKDEIHYEYGGRCPK